MAFPDDEVQAIDSLTGKFPKAYYRQMTDLIQQNALFIFIHGRQKMHSIKLHLEGTDFQIKVWETLLKIPMGRLTTYRSIARHIESPNALRAGGTAIGDNPVTFLIPCYRG